MRVDLSKINVLAELEHFGIAFQYANSESEIKLCCPFHKDNSPSCFLNTQKKEFKCHAGSCEKRGDFLTLLAAILKTTRAAVTIEVAKRYSIESDEQIVDPVVVEQYHKDLPTALPLLAELYKRGVSDAMISKHRIGYDSSSKRITIPIKNSQGLFVNIRKYLPGAPGAEKMKNSRGHGKSRLYPIEQLQYEIIVLTGGELKAIVAAEELNQYGIGAICATAGEGNWDDKLTTYFTGKKVFILLDIDEAGKVASQRVARFLSRVTSWLGIAELPLDINEYPKGDINDFVALGHKLFPILAEVPEWTNTNFKLELEDTEPVDYELVDCIQANIAGTRVRTRAVITALDTAPYIIPKEVTASCDRSQKECSFCAIFRNKETDTYKINHESPNLLDMVMSKKHTHHEAIMESLNIPKKCRVVEFQTINYYNAEDTRISPQLEITNRAADRLLQPALIISEDKAKDSSVELNETYELIGRNWPHPQTQQSTLIISNFKQTSDALSTYKLQNPDELEIFSCRNGNIQEKLERIYSDLSANVTRIFSRSSLHLAVDLAYHSPLFIHFDGKENIKGWSEILILGDSAQGKSETAQNLQRHYGLGEKIECKNASVAGLLGGLQKHGDRWFVSWGIIPTHDKRLVILEELKGASTDIIAKLTDMRSSGIAEIPKIEKRRTHSRTRLLALSNSRSGRALSSYNFGIEAVRELVGSLEDIRRFDAAILVSQDEIDPKKINALQKSRPKVQHRYRSDLCRNLILWAWTANCYFSDDALQACLNAATNLSNKYTDQIPLIDKGSARYKIARLSAALAARLFSHDRNYNILVQSAHVDYIAKFLDETYSSDTFGYLDYTASIKAQEELLEPNIIQHELQLTPFPRDLCKKLLYKSCIEHADIQDWNGWDRESASNLLGVLVRKHAVYRVKGGGYYKTSKFIELLKGLLSNGALIDRPKHIEEVTSQKQKGKF